MRTTLKKGTRGARNGHAELPGVPPQIPPSTASRSFYSMPRRNPLRVVGKFFLWLVAHMRWKLAR